MASTVTVVRGKRGRPHSSANARRNMTVSTSVSPTAPATFHCTFSHVTQNSVARKRVPVIFTAWSPIRAVLASGADGRAGKPTRPEHGTASGASFESPQHLGKLLDARGPAEALTVVRRQRRPVQRARLPLRVKLGQRRGERGHVVCR